MNCLLTEIEFRYCMMMNDNIVDRQDVRYEYMFKEIEVEYAVQISFMGSMMRKFILSIYANSHLLVMMN